MGMYTQINFNASMPKKIAKIISSLHDSSFSEMVREHFPDHEFFDTDRGRWLFGGGDSYFPAGSPLRIDRRWTFQPDDDESEYAVTFTSAIKNYDQEIEKFIDWVKPHVSGAGNLGFFAYSLYEEGEVPTLYFTEELEQ